MQSIKKMDDKYLLTEPCRFNCDSVKFICKRRLTVAKNVSKPNLAINQILHCNI